MTINIGQKLSKLLTVQDEKFVRLSEKCNWKNILAKTAPDTIVQAKKQKTPVMLRHDKSKDANITKNKLTALI